VQYSERVPSQHVRGTFLLSQRFAYVNALYAVTIWVYFAVNGTGNHFEITLSPTMKCYLEVMCAGLLVLKMSPN
jgi:hypothetical protein